MEEHRRHRRSRNRYGKMLGLLYLKKSTKIILTRTTFVAIFIISSIFFSYAFNNLTEEYKKFIFSQYASILMMIMSLRVWWIYNCEKQDTAGVITMRIITSTFIQLITLAFSLLTLIFMQIVKDSKGQTVSFFLFFFSYIIMVGALMLNIGNCMKLIFLIIVFIRKGEDEVDSHVREVLSNNHPETEMFRNLFRNQGLQILIRRIENQELNQNHLTIEQVERRERRNRGRRIIRHLRNRGVQESTIIAIRTILESAFERRDRDTPEERVKIYSRIERSTFDKEKYGENEGCPICCIEMEQNSSIKVIPGCGHLFHEDCIEQWILKARANRIQGPVCRLDIKGKLDELDRGEQEDQDENGENQENNDENDSTEARISEEDEDMRLNPIGIS